MKYLAVFLILTILIAGCVQSSGTGRTSKELQDSDMVILNSSWTFEDNCQYGNESVGHVDIQCYKKGLECEVYINDKKSTYGLNSLQSCDEREITIAEIELAEKPDFISVQSGNKYYYSRRDSPKIIEICCSYLNLTSNELIRDDEVCKVTRLDAQCPEQSGYFAPVANGFEQINVTSWDLDSNGILNLRVENEAGQDAVVRAIYINDVVTIPADLPMSVPNGTESQNITVAGEPKENIENNYVTRLAIEYYLTSKPYAYLNSTGTIIGAYS